jgi:hypothetical protein
VVIIVPRGTIPDARKSGKLRETSPAHFAVKARLDRTSDPLDLPVAEAMRSISAALARNLNPRTNRDRSTPGERRRRFKRLCRRERDLVVARHPTVISEPFFWETVEANTLDDVTRRAELVLVTQQVPDIQVALVSLPERSLDLPTMHLGRSA